MCRPHGCSSCWAWFRRTADAGRLDPQARQHLDLVHRGRAGPEHGPAPPGPKGGFRTRKEARDALLQAQAALRSGTFVEPSRRTVSSYLLEEWLPENQPPRLRPSSYANYTNYTRFHVVPRLGDVELQRLTPSNLSGFYRALLTDARRDGQGLAPKTVRNIHAMLHRALKDAVRLGYLVRNVADAVTPPRASSPEMQVWTPEQLRAFLAHVRGDRLYALWLLVATIGMRRAELAGLRWIDVDVAAARLSPRRPRVVVNYVVHESEPKTRMGKRSLALDPATLAALQEHKGRQDQERTEVGSGWRDSGLVFTRPDGSPIHPDLITDWFRRLARGAGLPPIRLHDVRHSYATAALAAGVPAKVVSERLGHATIAITLDVYSHVIPGMDEAAANAVASLILDGSPQSEGPGPKSGPPTDK
jgi:integrase